MKPLELDRLPDEYTTLPSWIYYLPKMFVMAWLAMWILNVFFWPGSGKIPVRLLLWHALAQLVLCEAFLIVGMVLLVLHLAGVI